MKRIHLVLAAFAIAFAGINGKAQTTWSARAPIPTPRGGAGYCVCNNRLYVLGGEYQAYGYITNRNEIYDPISDTWTTGTPLPQALYGPAAVAVNGQILLIGGRPQGPPWYSVSTVSSYNPSTGVWSTKAPMSRPRDSVRAFELGGLVYAIGGYDQSSDQRLSDVEVYDPVHDLWISGPAMPTACSDAAAAVIGSKIYVFGGIDNSGFGLDLVQVFDTLTQSWTTKTPLPTARWSNVAAVLNGLVYVTGGNCSSGIDIYDPATDGWSSGPAMPAADATAGQAIGTVSSTGGCPDTIVVTGGSHVNCGGGSYPVSDTIALSLPAPIVFDFSGFLSPIGGADATGGSFANPLRTFKMGSTIPVRFTTSCGGSPVLAGTQTLQAVKYSNATTFGAPMDATPQDAATAGNQFRLTTDGQWQFNLDTKGTGMSVGIWLLRATLSDGSQHTVWIQVK